jgi:hypothetical protein
MGQFVCNAMQCNTMQVAGCETDGDYVALTKLHADSLYGHQDGEVNFWMPFTSIDETS